MEIGILFGIMGLDCFPIGKYAYGKVVVILKSAMTEYRTVKETAEDWGVSKRWVNMCIADKRIAGAIKKGNIWLVPKTAANPTDTKKEINPHAQSIESGFYEIITSADIPVPIENPDYIFKDMDDERMKSMFEIAFAFWRSDFDRSIRIFHEIKDDSVKLCASASAISAAVCAGDYSLFLEIETFLRKFISDDKNDSISKYAELALAAAYTGAMAPNMVADWIKKGDFDNLFLRQKMDAFYTRAKYYQSRKEYGSMLAVAQTALSFCETGGGILYTEINLKMACAIACCEMDLKEEAEKHILDTMKICMPGGFTAPFVMNIPMAGGLIEKLLEREYPEEYKKIIERAGQVIPNWFDFHNRFTKEKITQILSHRDYQMARLVVQGEPYKKIAEQFSISTGTVTNRMQIIYEMLFITGRDRKKELEKYIF